MFGVASGVKQLWPVATLKSLLHSPAKSVISTDELGRLTQYPGKQHVACPAQRAGAAVLLVVGQSNAGNHQGQRYQAIDGRVVQFFDGQCYAAGSPLLGSTGDAGESSTLLANKLVQSGLYDQVVIVPAAVGPSTIRRWAAGGDLNHMLMSVIDQVKPLYHITHVLWDQGESDFLESTDERAYAADFRSLATSIRDKGISAPIYVSEASFMGYVKPWIPDNPVVTAQRALLDQKSILPGPDTDAIPIMDRFDGIHFSATGQDTLATLWVNILRPSPSGQR